MAVSELEFQEWIETCKKIGATHLISVVDTFDHSDYPIFVMPDDDFLEKRKQSYFNEAWGMRKLLEGLENPTCKCRGGYCYKLNNKGRYVRFCEANVENNK